jgi:hypothetical protein
MEETTPRRIQLLQGNATVRRIMVTALEESGFEITYRQEDGETDLVVVDVDSGLELAEAQKERWAESERPVLVCGLRNSREHYPDVAWMQRPFSPDGLVAQCRDLLGLAEAPGLAEDSTPQTQRLTLDDAERLEEELGLEKGTLDLSHEDSDADLDLSLDETNNLGPDDVPEFLEMDTSNSIELDADDLEEVGGAVAGGCLRGDLERETVSVEELEWSDPVVAPPEAVRSETLNQTMPDAPAVMAPQRVTDEGSAPHNRTESSVSRGAASRPRRGSQVEFGERLERQIDEGAQILATSWSRIGLVARPRDRANHIRGVLRAIFSDGAVAAADEIERIPGASGFSGDLGTLQLADILATTRARQLRGRLELSVGTDDFVLYLDGDRLIDLDNISGNDDRLLLDILLDEGMIAHQIYEEFGDSLGDELSAPIQMQLRQEDLVTPQDLVDAREKRVRRVCAELISCRQGTFAFVSVEQGAGQAWPVDDLSINIDQLLEFDGDEHSDDSAPVESPGQVESSAPSNDEVPFPEGLEMDSQLTPTVEVSDPDSES